MSNLAWLDTSGNEHPIDHWSEAPAWATIVRADKCGACA